MNFESKFKPEIWVNLFKSKGNGFNLVYYPFVVNEESKKIGICGATSSFPNSVRYDFMVPGVFHIGLSVHANGSVLDFVYATYPGLSEETLDNYLMAIYLQVI
jgi:hypothetical protein